MREKHGRGNNGWLEVVEWIDEKLTCMPLQAEELMWWAAVPPTQSQRLPVPAAMLTKHVSSKTMPHYWNYFKILFSEINLKCFTIWRHSNNELNWCSMHRSQFTCLFWKVIRTSVATERAAPNQVNCLKRWHLRQHFNIEETDYLPSIQVF